MEDDPRFPNRKKKRDWDMSALNKPAEAAPEPTGEQTEEAQLPVTNYRVVAPAQKTKEQELAKQAELDSHRASPEAEQQPAVPIVDSPVYKAPAPDAQAQAFAEQALKAGTQKSAANRTWIYAAVVIGLGVLLGVVVASYNSVSGTPNGRYDLRLTATATGDDAGFVVSPLGDIPPIPDIGPSLFMENMEAFLLGHDTDELIPEHIEHGNGFGFVIKRNSENRFDNQPLDGEKLHIESLYGLNKVYGVKQLGSIRYLLRHQLSNHPPFFETTASSHNSPT